MTFVDYPDDSLRLIYKRYNFGAMANGAKQEYWGISCRSGMQMIAFAKVKYGPMSDGE